MTTTTTRPDTPGHLSKKGAELWRSIIDRYELEDEELATLTLALESWDMAQTARRTIGREGQIIEDRFGQIKPHPAIQIHRDALASWARLTTQLGIPADTAQDRPERDTRGHFAAGGRRDRGKA
jgi:P27 family predicted phage terminase small subunit